MPCRMWTIQERSGRSLSWPCFLPAACAAPHIQLTGRVRPRPKPNPDCRPRLLFIGGLLCAHPVLGGDGGESSPVKFRFSDVRPKKRKSCNGGGTAEFCVEADARLASPGSLVFVLWNLDSVLFIKSCFIDHDSVF